MMVIVAVWDRKVEAFVAPAVVKTIGLASRSFLDMVSGTGDTDLARHPEDFRLFQLGTLDEDSGRVDSLDLPKLIVDGEGLRDETKQAVSGEQGRQRSRVSPRSGED